jgi:serine/threonine protein kinase
VEHDYVRVCPVCDVANPPERARCPCGASLAGIDFSLRAPPAVVPASDTPTAASPLSQSSKQAAANAEAMTPPPRDLPSTTSGALADNAVPAGVACPYGDCAQINPPGRTRCIYCNRALDGAASPGAPSSGASRPLPSALRGDYDLIDAFPATGSEADLLLVAQRSTGRSCVAKLYRKGLEPDMRLLALLSSRQGDHLVRILAHGVSDGVAYEVQEYLANGTLRDLLRDGPITRDVLRRIVSEIASALDDVHAQRIIHRDLKPENVLVRVPHPLQLALTDFGIASLREATQHFTGGARTAKYAAPEALTGVIDDKSDWWALGMIVIEAAAGRHPFEGLTEQVINHRLATQPIDVRSVYDDATRALCRGLLMRDPQHRWSSAEVARWLAGDPTLVAPADNDGPPSAARPYRIGQSECATVAELATALARHWDLAAKDVARGQIARWLEHELHDYDLVRKLHDFGEERDISNDLRLLRFLLIAAPDLPRVWKGAPVTVGALLAAARRCVGIDDGAADAERWLDSIAREGVLARFDGAGDADLAALDRRWRDGWAHFARTWTAAQAAEEAWRKQARTVAGAASSHVVSVDDLMFAAPAWLGVPDQATVNAALLLTLCDGGYANALAAEVLAGRADLAGHCAWYDALCDRVHDDSVGTLVARRLLDHARDDAAMEKRREDGSREARLRIIGEARERLRAKLDDVTRAVTPDGGLDARTVASLHEAISVFLQTCHHNASLGLAEPDYLTLCRSIDKLSQHAYAAQRALGRCEEVKAFNAIFMRPERLGIAFVFLLATLLLRTPIFIFAGIVAGACVFGYRWYVDLEATEAALSALRLLRLHGKSLLRADAKTHDPG